jgi:YHS domain-containing protein
MTTAIDPVCKAKVDVESTDYNSTIAGGRYYFCSEDCKEEFEERPSDYAAARAVA